MRTHVAQRYGYMQNFMHSLMQIAMAAVALTFMLLLLISP